MRKLAISLVVLIVLLLGGLYVLAFTQWGNNILKPYIENAVSEKIQKDVKLEKFTLTMSHLTLKASVENEAILIADGDLSLFAQSFDIKYHAQAQNLKTPVITIKEKLEIDGNAKGDIDDFIAQGSGHAFGSNLNYNVHLVDKMPLDGIINAKGLELEQLLALAGKPAYVNGKLDINSNIKNENNKLSGTIHLVTNKSVINEKFVKRDFNVSLPKNSKFIVKSDGVVTSDTLSLQNNIVSTLVNLQTKKTDINLKTLDMASDFIVNIPNLSYLQFATKKKLYGKLDVMGNVSKKADKITLDANSKIFDGAFIAKYSDDSLVFKGDNFEIKKILALLGEPAFAYGKLNLDGKFDNVSKDSRNGLVNIKAKNGELVGSLMRKKFNLEFPPVSNFWH